MENKGLVSVIIPVYNVEAYLEQCVESVLNQSYSNIEVLLIDDGSIDSSGKICDNYREKSEKIEVFHQKNQGSSSARNCGFEQAKGEFVYFLDSDDWILKDTLETLVEKAGDKADFVFFDANSFEDDDPSKQIKQNYLRKNQYKTNVGIEVLRELQKNKEYHSAVPLMLIRKSFLEENKISFEPGIVYEDMLYTFELFCRGRYVSYVNKAFYQRRYRSNSIMTSKKTKKNFTSAKKVFEEVKNTAQECQLIEDIVAKQYISRCAFNALNYYKDLNKEEKTICKEMYKNLKKMILTDEAYGNKALKMRCFGTFPWFIYKVFEKIFT